MTANSLTTTTSFDMAALFQAACSILDIPTDRGDLTRNDQSLSYEYPKRTSRVNFDPYIGIHIEDGVADRRLAVYFGTDGGYGEYVGTQQTLTIRYRKIEDSPLWLQRTFHKLYSEHRVTWLLQQGRDAEAFYQLFIEDLKNPTRRVTSRIEKRGDQWELSAFGQAEIPSYPGDIQEFPVIQSSISKRENGEDVLILKDQIPTYNSGARSICPLFCVFDRSALLVESGLEITIPQEPLRIADGSYDLIHGYQQASRMILSALNFKPKSSQPGKVGKLFWNVDQFRADTPKGESKKPRVCRSLRKGR